MPPLEDPPGVEQLQRGISAENCGPVCRSITQARSPLARILVIIEGLSTTGMRAKPHLALLTACLCTEGTPGAMENGDSIQHVRLGTEIR